MQLLVATVKGRNRRGKGEEYGNKNHLANEIGQCISLWQGCVQTHTSMKTEPPCDS